VWTRVILFKGKARGPEKLVWTRVLFEGKACVDQSQSSYSKEKLVWTRVILCGPESYSKEKLVWTRVRKEKLVWMDQSSPIRKEKLVWTKGKACVDQSHPIRKLFGKACVDQSSYLKGKACVDQSSPIRKEKLVWTRVILFDCCGLQTTTCPFTVLRL
jgi:hypothetical protein